jgi:2-methylcitrate dehydratase PrpD
MGKSYTQSWAESITKIRFADLAPNVIEKAKLLVLDFLGATAAGSNTPTAGMLQRAVAEELGPGSCWIIGRENRKTSALMAALINGFNAHIVEYDDTHRNSLYHPGAPTMPAALVTAQFSGANGRTLIEGIVAGYEIGIRLAEAINPAHYQFWHTTGTVGCFAAAAASGKILGLTGEQLMWALGNAGTQAAGLWEFQADGAMTKPLHPGKAAQAGILAAFLSRQGFTGTSTILEGKQGFCKATSSQYDMSRIVPKDQDLPRLLEVTFKNYPSCGHTHTPIDAALKLYPDLRETNEKIAKVKVITNQVAVRVAGNDRPQTEYEAKFSIPYCVAYALQYGRLDLFSFGEEALQDSQVRLLMKKVELQIGEEMERVFQQKRPTELHITLEDGLTLSSRVEFRRGDPENPPTAEEVRAKYRMLVQPVLSPSQIEEWQRSCERLEGFNDMRAFPHAS